jgi:hypothetical protein
MVFSSTTHSLSALHPAKFNYNYNNVEKLKYSGVQYSSGLGHLMYDLFKNAKDIAISKKNLLCLTEVKDLTNVFDDVMEEYDIGRINGAFLLKTQDGRYLKHFNNTICVGGAGSNMVVSIVPIGDDIVELYIDDQTRLEVDTKYPYTVFPSRVILSPTKQYRQQFELDYFDGKITLKAKTADGYRFLSYGVDRTLRAVGVMLDYTSINPYIFVPEFITPSNIVVGFEPKTTEVQYFNELETFKDRYNLNIKSEKYSDTNLLATCTLNDVVDNDNSNINIALLKTNYTSTGTYVPLH